MKDGGATGGKEGGGAARKRWDKGPEHRGEVREAGAAEEAAAGAVRGNGTAGAVEAKGARTEGGGG